MLVALYGPTSFGKTALSLDLRERLARELGIEPVVISADSRQVYRQLDVGTSKTLPVGRQYTVDDPRRWLADVLAEAARVTAPGGNVVLLVPDLPTASVPVEPRTRDVNCGRPHPDHLPGPYTHRCADSYQPDSNVASGRSDELRLSSYVRVDW